MRGTFLVTQRLCAFPHKVATSVWAVTSYSPLDALPPRGWTGGLPPMSLSAVRTQCPHGDRDAVASVGTDVSFFGFLDDVGCFTQLWSKPYHSIELVSATRFHGQPATLRYKVLPCWALTAAGSFPDCRWRGVSREAIDSCCHTIGTPHAI